MADKIPIVVVGGGTGTHTILRGLRRWHDRLDITAVVNMSDSGGSTGRLRDEFGMLPVGDARMALAALAEDGGREELLLRELFLYRFQNGDGLRGHNLGNILLAALADLLGSEAAAIAAASRILRVAGTVLPVTADNTQLTAVYDDGFRTEREHALDEPPAHRAGHRVVELALAPRASVTPEAAAALRAAALIILGPGDLYSSLLANCVVDGVPAAIQASAGQLVFVSNLMERFGQTEGMSVAAAVAEIETYAGRRPDIVLINDAPLLPSTVAWYEAQEGTKPVVDDADTLTGIQIVRTDLISSELFVQSAHDRVKRSLIRHEPDKLAHAILNILRSAGV